MTGGPMEFLTNCLDEDELAARKAAALCGCHPEAPDWRFSDGSTDGRILIVGDPHPDIRRKLGRRWNGTYDGLFTAEHIVRHDPARVLREVEAKRRLLAVHRPYVDEPDQACLGCAGGIMWRSCPVWRALAAVYADRPGYRQEWRP
ncbi:DUF6221 family protein [Streptomyces sp. NPDC059994]|uniref:DUF6221 family protein n=1 Tax=Streptomyces sp. NPDC059994 TaxID=3347029 RepID=UPI0036B64726